MHIFLRRLLRRSRYGFLLSGIAVSFFAAGAPVAHAETHASGTLAAGTTTWSAAEGPYILDDDLTVPAGASLVVMPGTKVVGASLLMYTPGIYADGGSVQVRGKGRSRVSFDHIGGISAYNRGSLDIADADIDSRTRREVGISVVDGSATIATTTIINARVAVEATRSAVSIWGSRFYYDESGLIVRSPLPPMLVDAAPAHASASSFAGRGAPDTGGIGNALEEDYPVSIIGSSFLESGGYAIANYAPSPIHATGNWWGGSSPNGGVGNSMFGSVEAYPWLSAEPPLDLGPVDCCSSILFIPGIEASRLYRYEASAFGTTTNRLWEPNRNLDVEKLFMDASGSSTDRSIYVGEPIDAGLGISDVYGSFMRFLDGLATDGVIGEWKPFGYDWRKPPADVAVGREIRATTTESLIETVVDMARRSKTGKVAIIAHSNGGLVAKALIKTLAERGQSSLVDSLISVAVPYLGTPAAIGGLLHGDGQSIARGLILSQSTARSLARNMPSAYSLLPSSRYFSEVFSPVISFASSTIPGLARGSYPADITSASDELAFIVDAYGDRTDPATSTVSAPIRGNASLAPAAQAFHAALDAYNWPAEVSRWAIIGWNALTPKGIEYAQKISCRFGAPALGGCATRIEHHGMTTLMGDGSVVAASAAYESGSAVSLDLASESRRSGGTVDHSNILGASTTQAAISAIIRSGSGNGAAGALDPLKAIAAFPGATIGRPDSKNDRSFSVLSTHSPVELHVYDASGRHTGPVAKPASLADNDAVAGAYEEGIPGSRFEAYDDGDGRDAYVYLPEDAGQTYSVSIAGTGFGEFTFDVERYVGDQKASSIAYAPAPVTPLSVAATTVGGSSTPVLRLDLDGDGVPDMAVATSSSEALADPAAYVSAMRKAARYLAPKGLLKRLEHVADMLHSGKRARGDRAADFIPHKFGHLEPARMSASDKAAFIRELEREASLWEDEIR